ncbi:hypothetical protein M231_07695 [Tremella mesenterica]|uniref:Cep57 centrosome microtubule-binding domain-containing protein n=1 Tax=Tremella mesenterica TaxID=5217 RepID=A0A4Q1B8Q9_TREME|nr:hypothetical protein M231_07695 [Tremella mesenterica]
MDERGATPILPSHHELDRCRLESTVDYDLASLSLNTLSSISSHPYPSQPQKPTQPQSHPHPYPSNQSNNNSRNVGNFSGRKPHSDKDDFSDLSSLGSVEYPRGVERSFSLDHYSLEPHGTPKPRSRIPIGIMGKYDSPVSTIGHHVSDATLAAGVFRNGKEMDGDCDDDEDFDPERSLGRLVGELGRVMSGKISPRPTSPFSPLRSPRSPSPITTAANLSYTLNRSTALPSPPTSRSSSAEPPSVSGFTAAAHRLEKELKTKSRPQPAPRRALSDTTAQIHNMGAPGPRRSTRPLTLGKEDVRPGSAPPHGDVTGMTGLLETPAKGADFGSLGKNAELGGETGGAIPQTLATLHARLRALETENSLSRRRVRELEQELEKAKGEVETAKRGGERRLREVIGEKTALEDLVKSLRSHLARLTVELEQNKTLVNELRDQLTAAHTAARADYDSSVRNDISSLRQEVERLSNEVQRLGGIVEEGLETRKKARGERTMRLEAEEAERIANLVKEPEMTSEKISKAERESEMERVKRDVQRRQEEQEAAAELISLNEVEPRPSKLRQGLHAAAVVNTQMMPPTVEPPTRTLPSRHHDQSNLPTRTNHSRSHSHSHPHANFHSQPHSHVQSLPQQVNSKLQVIIGDRTRYSDGSSSSSSSTTRRKERRKPEGPNSPFPSIRESDEKEFFSPRPKVTRDKSRYELLPESVRNTIEKKGEVPPQTVLARVIGELEADFGHYRVIYAELADQYKVLDPASHIAKRHVLADHLREVIDTLEHKADQISALYELLSVHDLPSSHSHDERKVGQGKIRKSVPDIVRMVRDSLGEEGLKRLKKDGIKVAGLT